MGSFGEPVMDEPSNADSPEQEATSAHGALAQPRHLWYKPSARTIPDEFGYGRIPAFWFTLNLPFNYLYEIHRFQ